MHQLDNEVGLMGMDWVPCFEMAMISKVKMGVSGKSC
jgi:hypothetical protein